MNPQIPKLKWNDVLRNDIKEKQVKIEQAQDRRMWRQKIRWKRPKNKKKDQININLMTSSYFISDRYQTEDDNVWYCGTNWHKSMVSYNELIAPHESGGSTWKME